MNTEQLRKEFKYRAVRSSGSGGQHVNKVSTKVELSFNVEQSLALSPEELLIIKSKLARRISKEGMLKISSDATRSQLKNKEIVTHRMLNILNEALKVEAVRIKTKTPRRVIQQRLEHKKRNAQKKVNRKPPKID